MHLDSTGYSGNPSFFHATDVMQQSISNLVGWTNSAGQNSPLGYTEYGNIFAKYIIHGVKLKWTLRFTSTTPTHSSTFGMCYHTSDGTAAPTSVAGAPPLLAAYPLGSMGTVAPNKPYYIKRYMPNSKIAGVDVRKFDRFTKLWMAAPDVNPIYQGFTCTMSLGGVSDNYQLAGTTTWYVSAVAIKESIGTDPAAAAALKNMTVPLTEDFGEPATPGVIDHQNLLKSGVAQSKRSLQQMNMGGNA